MNKIQAKSAGAAILAAIANDTGDSSWRLSYGDPAFEGRSIIDGTYGGQFRRIGALETYAISLVPEPSAHALLAGGLGSPGLIGRAARCRGR